MQFSDITDDSRTAKKMRLHLNFRGGYNQWRTQKISEGKAKA